jgi:hypothetical protein
MSKPALLARGLWEETMVASNTIVPSLSRTTEDALFTELERPKDPFDSHLQAANRREAALRGVFTRLSPHESLALQRRLEASAPGDTLVTAFERLVPERRARLLAHLEELRCRR